MGVDWSEGRPWSGGPLGSSGGQCPGQAWGSGASSGLAWGWLEKPSDHGASE